MKGAVPQLDPALQVPLSANGQLPPVPDYQLTPPSLLGESGQRFPSVMPQHLTPPGGAPAATPSLDPAKMASDPAKMTDQQLSVMFRNRETLALLVWEPWMHNPKLRRRP